MRICVITNAKSSSGGRIEEVLNRFKNEPGCVVRTTTAPGDASRLAREAVEQRFSRVVVAGGDGTVSQVVNGIAPDFDRIEVALVPLGTGNDLARSLGIPTNDLGAACELALRGATRRIDVIRLSDDGAGPSYCINAASGGFGGEVATDIRPADKARWGAFAYWLTAAAKLIEVHEFQVELSLDEVSLELELYGLGVANGRYLGGGFPIAPRALLDDGLIDVTTIPVLPRMELLAAGLNFILDRHHQDDRVRTYQSRRVSLRTTPHMPFSVDGEPMRAIQTNLEIIPRVLPIVAGRQAVGLSC